MQICAKGQRKLIIKINFSFYSTLSSLSALHLPPHHLPFLSLMRATSCCSSPLCERETIPREEEGEQGVTERNERWREADRMEGGRERTGVTRRSGSEVGPACARVFCDGTPPPHTSITTTATTTTTTTTREALAESSGVDYTHISNGLQRPLSISHTHTHL